jgi:hypothetical protein
VVLLDKHQVLLASPGLVKPVGVLAADELVFLGHYEHHWLFDTCHQGLDFQLLEVETLVG